MPQILVLHGPNLNLLGSREPGIYGADTLDSITNRLRLRAGQAGVGFDTLQSNHKAPSLIACRPRATTTPPSS